MVEGQDAEARLAGIRAGLQADGYDLIVHVGPNLVVEITAGPDACADCLVPKALMKNILRGALGSEAPEDIVVRYPADATA